jgi:Flp pilus assembly protein TadD
MNDVIEDAADLVHARRFREAIVLLEEIQRDGIPDAHADYLLAYCLHNLRNDTSVDLSRACRLYDSALARGFDEFWVRYNKGSLLALLGDHESAVDNLVRASRLSGGDASSYAANESTLHYLTSEDTGTFVSLRSPVVVSCVPKCGTMLLRTILAEVLGQRMVIPSRVFDVGLVTTEQLLSSSLENKVYLGHLLYDDVLAERLTGVPKILLIRDPRDYVVSMAHFLTDSTDEDRWGAIGDYFRELPTWEDRMSAVILGVSYAGDTLPSAYDCFVEYFKRWCDERTLVVRYEDLVSSAFGGEDQRVLTTVRRVLDFLDVRVSSRRVWDRIATGSSPKRSDTFRVGGAGHWRQELTPRNVAELQVAAPGLVSALGYESDESWSTESAPLHELAPISDQRLAALSSGLSDIRGRYDRLHAGADGSPAVQHLANVWGAERLCAAGEYGRAVDVLRRLIADGPVEARWHYLLAYALQGLMSELGRGALDQYSTALERGYDEYWIRYHRGLVYLAHLAPRRARTDLERAAS